MESVWRKEGSLTGQKRAEKGRHCLGDTTVRATETEAEIYTRALRGHIFQLANLTFLWILT